MEQWSHVSELMIKYLTTVMNRGEGGKEGKGKHKKYKTTEKEKNRNGETGDT